DYYCGVWDSSLSTYIF
nr:immunoglobulin light chain junction region [Macaca mulatta]MOW57387.1 immunoglobulin light chain junction region [Macaca mulatta]MOW59688.1 immunoglobulin light chain junction region [Macaca mulatta]MOW60367.1 immunoglobulin light chain junction region [Macaca mulatta]MOY15678.1 immunoglobulin light chain junction region [Macaca mulatta]